MQALSSKLLQPAGTLKFNNNKEKDSEMRASFQKTLGPKCACTGSTDWPRRASNKRDHVAGRLCFDRWWLRPRKDPDHPLVKNQQLGNALLSMELRSNVQLGKLDQARRSFPCCKRWPRRAATRPGATTVLKQLMGIMQRQLEEMGKKDGSGPI